jgi:hypothetical protein
LAFEGVGESDNVGSNLYSLVVIVESTSEDVDNDDNGDDNDDDSTIIGEVETVIQLFQQYIESLGVNTTILIYQ